MPNRIIKESICTSTEIDKLTPEEESFFYRLLVNCDDYGRIDGRHSIIRAKCYPLKMDNITNDKIEQLLMSLILSNLIKRYLVKNLPYIQVITWDKHQQIRAKKSKYPESDPNCNDVIVYDNNCYQVMSDDYTYKRNQLIANVPVIQSNPIQSSRNPINKISKDILPQVANNDENKNNGWKNFKDIQDILNSKDCINKNGFLINMFKQLHQSAPQKDFENLGGRIGVLVKTTFKGNYILAAQAIWESASKPILDSHLDFLTKWQLKKQQPQTSTKTYLPIEDIIGDK